MPIVIAPEEVVAPPVETAAWPGFAAMTWTGQDGSEWDMMGSSGIYLGMGVRGLTMPPVDRFVSTSPALAGSRWRGARTLERDVFWPLLMWSDEGSEAWVQHDRAFWSTMRPDTTGVWTVRQPNGLARSLRCRYVDDSDHATEIDPTGSGWEVYGIHLVAEQPYWEGDPVTRTWTNDAFVPFFGGSAGAKAPSFFISSGSSLVSATVSNPGDVDAYPVYTVTGPVDSVSVGYAGNTVSLGAVPAGQQRIIDTRPDRLTVTDANGVDKWSELTGDPQFDAPIPPGESVPLSLSMVGSGTVSLTLTPLYYRAW